MLFQSILKLEAKFKFLRQEDELAALRADKSVCIFMQANMLHTLLEVSKCRRSMKDANAHPSPYARPFQGYAQQALGLEGQCRGSQDSPCQRVGPCGTDAHPVALPGVGPQHQIGDEQRRQDALASAGNQSADGPVRRRWSGPQVHKFHATRPLAPNMTGQAVFLLRIGLRAPAAKQVYLLLQKYSDHAGL